MIYNIILKTEHTQFVEELMHKLAVVASHGDLEHFSIEVKKGSE